MSNEMTKMPTAEAQTRPTEVELVKEWRAQELERAGYPAEAARQLADRVDVDLHRAVDLLRNGCPAQTALAILL